MHETKIYSLLQLCKVDLNNSSLNADILMLLFFLKGALKAFSIQFMHFYYKVRNMGDAFPRSLASLNSLNQNVFLTTHSNNLKCNSVTLIVWTIIRNPLQCCSVVRLCAAICFYTILPLCILHTLSEIEL